MVLLSTERAERKSTIQMQMASLLLRQHPAALAKLLDAPEPEGDDGDTVAEQAREWKIAVEQAENVAKLAGKLPAGVTRSLEQSEAAGVDWRELLRRAWSETIPSDYTWLPPNRRHIWAGLYLPGVRSEAPGKSLSPSIAQGRSMRANSVFSRQEFAPSSKVNDRAECMCSTSIPKSIRPRSVKQGSQLHLFRLGAEERTSHLLPVVGRARICATDPGFPYRFMWDIPD